MKDWTFDHEDLDLAGPMVDDDYVAGGAVIGLMNAYLMVGIVAAIICAWLRFDGAAFFFGVFWVLDLAVRPWGKQ